ncbi:hypothetical protein B0H14DRAFT_1084821 [Mycena olivaceomarginata]|nr:hypothetical protein B0H14DRAFT_1084821 [Mycena olivaceomarginata]
MKSSTPLSRVTGKEGQSLSGEVPVGFHEGVKCICGDPDLSSRRTIQCQVCRFWSHVDCVGNPGEFTCKTCTANNRLKALSYMDAVKANFYDRPGVYNIFLEIMKDYKCRITDIARTIERICHLFWQRPCPHSGIQHFPPSWLPIRMLSGRQRGQLHYHHHSRWNHDADDQQRLRVGRMEVDHCSARRGPNKREQ